RLDAVSLHRLSRCAENARKLISYTDTRAVGDNPIARSPGARFSSNNFSPMHHAAQHPSSIIVLPIPADLTTLSLAVPPPIRDSAIHHAETATLENLKGILSAPPVNIRSATKGSN